MASGTDVVVALALVFALYVSTIVAPLTGQSAARAFRSRALLATDNPQQRADRLRRPVSFGLSRRISCRVIITAIWRSCVRQPVFRGARRGRRRITEIRLGTLKADYDSRVAALEDRLSQLEAAAAAQASAPAPEATAAPPSPVLGRDGLQPAISVILAGLPDLSQDPEATDRGFPAVR
jgi:hypothetical protein